MAATSLQENEPDSTVYESRTSFLNLLEEKQRALNKKALLHRFVYIARLAPELADKQELEVYYENLFNNLKHQHQGEDATGILLVYPSYVVHLIESSIEMVHGVIRDLQKMSSKGNALLVDPKILLISHDVPTRLYQQWTYRVLNITASGEGYEQGKQSVESLAVECVTTLLKFGVFILKSPKFNLKTSKENLHETVPDLLIPQDLIGFLLNQSELDTPSQFIRRYDQPVDITLDGELVWPIQESIAFKQLLTDTATLTAQT
uniref:testis-expressed protein 47-like n=1 Tax=Styela clava TaxID=7725 RepID=UPI00193A6906|nr:testis-expressed protein 47-like [Styela clava]